LQHFLLSGKKRQGPARDLREVLDRQLALIEFENARRRTRPFAERAGLLTVEDVF